MVARSAARTVSRSPSPVSASARHASMLSASETRTPLRRRRFENSTTFASTPDPLVEEVLVARRLRALELRPLQLHVRLELLLRLADVPLVLEDRRERVGDELVIEALDVEQHERARPVERLADARHLLQIELADALHDRNDRGGEPLGDARHLELHDLELVRSVGEVDVEVEAPALERVRHLARVVAREEIGRAHV